MTDEEKDYVVKQIKKAALKIAGGQTIILDLMRKYNGRREKKHKEQKDD